MSSRIAVLVALVALLAPAPGRAIFHLSTIDEVMSGVKGDPNIQYVEIRMLTIVQSFVANTRLTAFSRDGTQHTELLLVPSNVVNAGPGVRWIMASADSATFLAASGITPDFTFSPGIPTPCGMVCWGAPGIAPPSSSTWSAADPNNYVDCVAYGGYTGPTKTSTHDGTPTSGTPTGLRPGDGTFSLTRVSTTGDNTTDFALACPTPTNNAGETGSFGVCPPPVASRCTGRKFAAAGKKAHEQLKCAAKAGRKGTAADPDCLAKVVRKFGEAWSKAEAEGDCLAPAGDEAAVEAKVDALVGDVAAALGAGAPSKCTARKLETAGKKARAKAECHAHATREGAQVDADCVVQAEFSAGWDRAEAKGDCVAPTGDKDAVEGRVDTFIADLASELGR